MVKWRGGGVVLQSVWEPRVWISGRLSSVCGFTWLCVWNVLREEIKREERNPSTGVEARDSLCYGQRGEGR